MEETKIGAIKKGDIFIVHACMAHMRACNFFLVEQIYKTIVAYLIFIYFWYNIIFVACHSFKRGNVNYGAVKLYTFELCTLIIFIFIN